MTGRNPCGVDSGGCRIRIRDGQSLMPEQCEQPSSIDNLNVHTAEYNHASTTTRIRGIDENALAYRSRGVWANRVGTAYVSLLLTIHSQVREYCIKWFGCCLFYCDSLVAEWKLNRLTGVTLTIFDAFLAAPRNPWTYIRTNLSKLSWPADLLLRSSHAIMHVGIKCAAATCTLWRSQVF